MNKHIVIVEDEHVIAQNYCDALRRQGYRVTHFVSRSEAWDALQEKLPDLAILDVGLGEENEGGFELCRDLRSHAPGLPIIFLTARDDDYDVVSGLRLGADDYLTKDVSQAHMLARITALFRRVEALRKPPEQDSVIERSHLKINLDRMEVFWKGEQLELTVTEFWILFALANHPGHVKNRQQLMDAANVVLDDNTITSHVKRIRRKFKLLDTECDGIQTVYGMGYRWVY